MYAGDEFYPDDVTSGPITEPAAHECEPGECRSCHAPDKDGCGACYLEAVEALLNDTDPVPACLTPTDDGEGYCAICGHAVEEREPVAAQRECE